MGEKQNEPFQLSFNAALKEDFQGSRVTSDGGLILVRELDERLGLGELIAEHLSDSRRGKNTQLPLADLFRAFCTRRRVGRRRGGWWPKWSFTLGSCFRGWDSL
jgi:predicted ribosome quality control (RQC) complex YloA/Tae2 family protein